MDKELKLSKEVSDKYQLNDIVVGNYDFPGYGEIDLQTLTLDSADKLVSRGFPYLVLRKKHVQANPEKSMDKR